MAETNTNTGSGCATLLKGLEGRRKNAGLSQMELAERLDVTKQAVSSWENGISIPRGTQLVKMADLFCCDVSDLFRDFDPEEGGDESGP